MCFAIKNIFYLGWTSYNSSIKPIKHTKEELQAWQEEKIFI